VRDEKPREIAAEILFKRENGRFVESILEDQFGRKTLKPEDRGFIQELVYGVVRWQLTLDWLITRKTQGKPQKPLVQNLLRMALYQMFWLERVPSYAAVNESVEICKRRGFVPQAKFINAVLRGYSREMEGTREELQKLKKNDLALAYSHPEWLCKRWRERFGEGNTVALLDWNNTPPPLYARVNHLRFPTERLLELWQGEGVSYKPVEWDWAANRIFQIEKHPPLPQLASFKQGGFYLQDPSTLLAPLLLQAQPGEAILDLCAAPGGKTTFIADLIQDKGRILAEDLVPQRLKLVSENAERLGVSCIITDTTRFPRDTAFDRVLVDAPCSNTGVMRRRVELRWRIAAEEIGRLAQTQLSLLKQAARRTRLGGTIVYSTCSLEREENEAVVHEFLSSDRRFRLDTERIVTPFADGVDGAYCARLVSTS
jgi:16S rRNA (cytosine967-C5)-methyltransferase